MRVVCNLVNFIAHIYEIQTLSVLKPSSEHFSLLLTIGSPVKEENAGIKMHVENPLVPSTFVDAVNL